MIESITKQDWGINKDTLPSDVENLGKILAEAYIVLGEEADKMLPKENEEFSKAICYIAENKPSKKNLYEYSTAVKIIKENVSKIESDEKLFESSNLDSIAEKMLNEFNEKYSSELTEEEKTALKELSLSENREEIFNKYKESCRNKIEEARNIFISNCFSFISSIHVIICATILLSISLFAVSLLPIIVSISSINNILGADCVTVLNKFLIILTGFVIASPILYDHDFFISLRQYA